MMQKLKSVIFGMLLLKIKIRGMLSKNSGWNYEIVPDQSVVLDTLSRMICFWFQAD